MPRRIIVLVVENTEVADDLSSVLAYAINPPWKPMPDKVNRATYQQERWDQESTDEYLLERLKRAAPKTVWISNTLIPEDRHE